MLAMNLPETLSNHQPPASVPVAVRSPSLAPELMTRALLLSIGLLGSACFFR